MSTARAAQHYADQQLRRQLTPAQHDAIAQRRAPLTSDPLAWALVDDGRALVEQQDKTYMVAEDGSITAHNLVAEGIACGPRFGKGHASPCQDAPSAAEHFAAADGKQERPGA